MINSSRRNLIQQSIILAVFTCILVAGCTPGDTPDTSTPTNTTIPTATNTPVPSNPDEPTNTPTPSETTTPTPIPLPELVGQVEIGAGGPCDVYRMGEFQFEGDWRIYEVFFTDPVQCNKLKQGDIRWVNYTHIEDKVVKYTKDFAHDIESGALIDELGRRLGVTINEMSQYAIYPNKAGVSNGHGIACLNDSNSIKSEYAACVGELRYFDNDNGFRLIVHLAEIIE